MFKTSRKPKQKLDLVIFSTRCRISDQEKTPNLPSHETRIAVIYHTKHAGKKDDVWRSCGLELYEGLSLKSKQLNTRLMSVSILSGKLRSVCRVGVRTLSQAGLCSPEAAGIEYSRQRHSIKMKQLEEHQTKSRWRWVMFAHHQEDSVRQRTVSAYSTGKSTDDCISWINAHRKHHQWLLMTLDEVRVISPKAVLTVSTKVELGTVKKVEWTIERLDVLVFWTLHGNIIQA